MSNCADNARSSLIKCPIYQSIILCIFWYMYVSTHTVTRKSIEYTGLIKIFSINATNVKFEVNILNIYVIICVRRNILIDKLKCSNRHFAFKIQLKHYCYGGDYLYSLRFHINKNWWFWLKIKWQQITSVFKYFSQNSYWFHLGCFDFSWNLWR